MVAAVAAAVAAAEVAAEVAAEGRIITRRRCARSTRE